MPQKIGLTYDEYIQHPMGVGNAVFSAKDFYKREYTRKWNDILLRENGIIKYSLYKNKHNFYIHFKIPSEVVEEFYYDTIIEFWPNLKEKKAIESESTLKNYNVRFFSNDPFFVFTYGHAFIKRDLIIKELINKLPREVIRKQAESRNPLNQVGYVKSLYFAYLEMLRRTLFNKSWFTSAPIYDPKFIFSTVTHADEKIADRQEKGLKYEKKEKKQPKPETNTIRDTALSKIGINPIKKMNKIASSINDHYIKPISKKSKFKHK